MIDKGGLDQIFSVVAKRWLDMSKDPQNKALQGLPSNFWMNSAGGKAGEKGHWITMIAYTENESDAAGLKEVMLRWQAKGNAPPQPKAPDLINIKRKTD